MTELAKEINALSGVLSDLTTLTVKDLVTLWQNSSIGDNSAAIEQALQVAVPQIVMPYVNAASEATAQWYQELVPDSPFKAEPFVDMPEQRISKSVSWAVNQKGGAATDVRLAGAAKRMVYDGSRQTVLFNASKEKVRWVRHAQPSACTFCKILATRGEVYTSFQSATQVVGRNKAVSALKAAVGSARGKRKVGSVGYHDHCRCLAVPVRKGTIYTPPAYVSQWDDMYSEARKLLRKEDGIFAPDIRDVIRKMRVLEKQLEVSDLAAAAERVAANAALKTELNVGVRAAMQRAAQKASQKAAEAREAALRARMLAREDENFQIDLELTADQRSALARMAEAAGQMDLDMPLVTNPRQIYQDIADWLAAEKFAKKSAAMKKGAQTKKLNKWLAAEKQYNQAVEDWLNAENTVLWLKAEKFYKKSVAMKKGAQTKKVKKWLQAEADWKAQQAQLAAQQAVSAANAADSLSSSALDAFFSQFDAPKIKPFNGGPDPLTLKPTGKKLSGVNGAEVWVDGGGTEWVVKFTSKFINDLEVSVAQLQQAVGLAAPDIYSLTVNGKAASVSRLFDAQDAFPSGSKFGIDKLNDVDILTLQQHQVLDWLISNFDSHSGNWLKTKDGNLVGIDKGQAFKFFGKDKLSWDYLPVSPLGGNVPTYNTLWQQWIKGSATELLDPGESGSPLNEFILNIMSMDDMEFRDLFTPYAKAALSQGKLSTGDVSVFLDKLEIRKSSLLDDFKAFYAKGLAERQKVVGPKPQSSGAIKNLIDTPKQPEMGPFGNGLSGGKFFENDLEEFIKNKILGVLTENSLKNSLFLNVDENKWAYYLIKWGDEKYPDPSDATLKSEIVAGMNKDLKAAKAAAGQSGPGAAPVTTAPDLSAVISKKTLDELMKNGTIGDITEESLIKALLKIKLDGGDWDLYASSYATAQNVPVDVYKKIKNEIDLFTAPVGYGIESSGSKTLFGGPFGSGEAFPWSDLQTFDMNDFVNTIGLNKDEFKNTLWLNVPQDQWADLINKYAQAVHPKDPAAKAKLAVNVYKDLKDKAGDINAAAAASPAASTAAAPISNPFIKIQYQQAVEDKLKEAQDFAAANGWPALNTNPAYQEYLKLKNQTPEEWWAEQPGGGGAAAQQQVQVQVLPSGTVVKDTYSPIGSGGPDGVIDGGPFGDGFAFLPTYIKNVGLQNVSLDDLKNTLWLNIPKKEWIEWSGKWIKANPNNPQKVTFSNQIWKDPFDLDQGKAQMSPTSTAASGVSQTLSQKLNTLAVNQQLPSGKELLGNLGDLMSNAEMTNIGPQAMKSIVEKLKNEKLLQNVDEDTFVEMALALDKADLPDAVLSYAVDLNQSDDLYKKIIGAPPASSYPQPVQDLWTALDIEDAPPGASDIDKLNKVKGFKDSYGSGSGFNPLKATSPSDVYLKDEKIYLNFDAEVGIQYLTQEQLIQGLTKVVKAGNDQIAEKWIIQYSTKKWPENSDKAFKEINKLKKDLADAKAQLQVASSSSPGQSPSFSAVGSTEKQLSYKELEDAKNGTGLAGISQEQIVKSVISYPQPLKEQWITEWASENNLTVDQVNEILKKIEQPKGRPILDPTKPGDAPKWERTQPKESTHKLPSAAAPDPTAAPGTAGNPHIFMVNQQADWKTVGRHYSDQNKRSWPSKIMGMISSYTGGGYRTMNAALRSGRKPTGYKDMDAAFHGEQTTVTNDWMIFTRGDGGYIGGVKSGHPALADLKANIGKEVEVPGYVSTSITETPAFGGACRIIFRVPPGSRILYVDGDIDSSAHLSTCWGEREVVLPRGQKVKVLDAQPSSNSRYKYDVVVELVEQPF